MQEKVVDKKLNKIMKREQYQKYFQNKKITLMGLGLLGRNLGDAKFLAECGAELIVTDLKSAEELKTSVEQLAYFENITFHLGEHRLEDFQNRDFILKGNGVPLKNKFIQEAEKNNIPIKMSVAWVFDILRSEKIQPFLMGITGTKGKSTITAMLENIWQAQQKDFPEKKFVMAGNIKGLGGLELLNQIAEKTVVLAELDSWQLQGFGTEKISPNLAVFTNFFEDHLNYYPDMQSYFDDKKNIFAWQNDYDYLVTLPENLPIFAQYTEIEKIPGKVELAFSDDFPADWQVKFFGKHMIKNAVLAQKTAQLANIPEKYIKAGLENFSGVEGRMQFLGEKKCFVKNEKKINKKNIKNTKKIEKVIFYNDNNSTTPNSTIAGLIALREKYPEKRILLVAGGTDKGFQYQELAEFIEKNIAHTLLFEASGTEKIVQNFSADFQNFQVVDFMSDVQTELQKISQSNDIIILSPACSSFGKQFKNEYDRSDQFVELFENF